MRSSKIGYRYDLDENLQIIQVPYHHLTYRSSAKDYYPKAGGYVPAGYTYRNGTLIHNNYLS